MFNLTPGCDPVSVSSVDKRTAWNLCAFLLFILQGGHENTGKSSKDGHRNHSGSRKQALGSEARGAKSIQFLKEKVKKWLIDAYKYLHTK